MKILLFAMMFVSLSAIAQLKPVKKAQIGPVVTLPGPTKKFVLPCPPNPTVFLQCNSTGYCSITSGALVPGDWAATSLLSTGMPPYLSVTNATFGLQSGSAKQGSAFVASCHYSYSFNGTVVFDAVKAYTPPSGKTNCVYDPTLKAIVCT